MDLTPIIVVPIIFYFTYKFLESLIRRKERMMLIEKLETLQPQSLQIGEAFSSTDFFPNKKFIGLRIGLLLTGIGFGLVVAWALMAFMYVQIASYLKESWELRQTLNIIYLASPILFGGIGLLISYVIERNQK